MGWWAPNPFGFSFALGEAGVRAERAYRRVLRDPDFEQFTAFFGKYVERKPNALSAWKNEENADSSITSVTSRKRAAERCWCCTSADRWRRFSTTPPPRSAGNERGARAVRTAR